MDKLTFQSVSRKEFSDPRPEVSSKTERQRLLAEPCHVNPKDERNLCRSWKPGGKWARTESGAEYSFGYREKNKDQDVNSAQVLANMPMFKYQSGPHQYWEVERP
ncbi:uncharacterized protein LOC142335059 isoform X2 [Convolutriloba macropyga]|uniref:uncharacterized protein LOC142335059 isoform X2 n=1 Tax=Convolutriloba macropyga TaxID=536237 RepID=UPI003F51E4C6